MNIDHNFREDSLPREELRSKKEICLTNVRRLLADDKLTKMVMVILKRSNSWDRTGHILARVVGAMFHPELEKERLEMLRT